METAAHLDNLADVAGFLGYAPQFLFPIVKNNAKFYRQCKIPKRTAGFRKLLIPLPQLRGVQRTINHKILSACELSKHVYSYQKGRSAILAARKLCGNKYVLKMDIKDFFDTIKISRVYGVYRNLGFKSVAAFILSKLSTCKGRLSQGAPTSPLLSNAVLNKFDEQMVALSSTWNIDYLRYSDDIYFTSPQKFNWLKLSRIVSRALKQHGFKENLDKRRFFPRGHIRFTLGLNTTKSTPQLSRHQKRKFRAAFHRAQNNPSWAINNLAVLSGMLAWYKAIYGKDEKWREYSAIIRVAKSIRIHESYQS